MKNCTLALLLERAEEAFSHSAKFGCRAVALFRVIILVALVFPIALAAQTTVLSSLDPGQLNAALQAGGTVTFAIDGTIVLTNTITLSNSVVLDGTNHSVTISGGGAVQIFNILPAGQLTLRNLIFANGVNIATSSYFGMTYPAASYGGAIFTQGTLDVENCTFTNNRAPGGNGPIEEAGFSGAGGAIYNSGGLNITNSLFVYNAAVGGSGFGYGGNGVGGAIYNAGGNISIGNVVFSNNATSGGGAAGGAFGNYCGNACGGAIYSLGGSIQAENIQVFNCSVYGGQSSGGGFGLISTPGVGDGGALYLAGCTASISNGTFSNNFCSGGFGEYATGGQSLGGSIVNTGIASFWNCEFEICQARGAGAFGASTSPGMGGAIYNSGTMQITGSAISNNSTTGGIQGGFGPSGDGLGGAIYNSSNLTIEGTILSGNSSTGGAASIINYGSPGNGWGGAIYNTGGLEIENSRLFGNSAASGAYYEGVVPPGNGWGGAIYNAGSSKIINSTLLENSTTVGEPSYEVSSLTSG
jgi:hypothetical protein